MADAPHAPEPQTPLPKPVARFGLVLYDNGLLALEYPSDGPFDFVLLASALSALGELHNRQAARHDGRRADQL